jgi:hypothetical protein
VAKAKRNDGVDRSPRSPLYTSPRKRTEKLELVLEKGRDSDGAFRVKNRKDTPANA